MKFNFIQQCMGAGLLAVAGCMPKTGRIHVYGFNWSQKSYYMHRMSAESQIVARLAQQHPILVPSPDMYARHDSIIESACLWLEDVNSSLFNCYKIKIQSSGK